jgi:predicted DNA-binding transcriptional regulator YafY
VRFAYRGRDGANSRREVEPHSLVNVGRRWYLVAWDGGREDWRTFRVDRLTAPAATGVRFAPRDLPAKDGAAFVSQSLSAAPNRYEARVTLHAPVDDLRRFVPAHWGSGLEPIDDKRCEYRTSDDDLDWLALRILMFRVDFEVHEPAELREHVVMLAERCRHGAG